MSVRGHRLSSPFALTGVLCLGGGYLAFLLVASPLAPAIFWPPAGLALGSVLVWGGRVLPAAFLGTAVAALLAQTPWPAALLLGLGVVVQAGVGSALLRRLRFDERLASLSDLFKLFTVGGLLAGLAAVAPAYLALADADWFWELSIPRAVATLAAAHLLAVMVFAPLLGWRARSGLAPAPGQAWEAPIALAALLLLGLMLAHPSLVGLPAGAFRPYPVLPFLLWLALRARPWHTALGVAGVYAMAASGVQWGAASLAVLLPDVPLLPLHGFVFAIAATFIALAALMLSRSLAEEALRASEARLRNIVDLLPNCLWETDAGGRFVYVSPQYRELTGCEAAQAHADPPAWISTVHPADRQAAAEAWRAAQAGERVETEFRLRHPQHGERWLRLRAVPCLDAQGRRMSAGILEDVSERKQAEHARLDELLAQKDLLIREVHHRIKNNLQTVTGLLRREAGKHPEACAAIEAAIAQVRSVALVHGLHGRLERHSIMLCELLPAVVDSVAGLTGVSLELDAPPPGHGGLVIQDSETVAVALILNELLINAVKHAGTQSAAGPAAAQVGMRRTGGAARVRIGNLGVLPPGFDFARGQGIGTGLGLVRALRPQPGMEITFAQVGERVEVEVDLGEPVLHAAPDDPAAESEHTGGMAG